MSHRMKARAVGTGRNDLCPCGSGKKHKKCCGLYAKPSVPLAINAEDRADAVKFEKELYPDGVQVPASERTPRLVPVAAALMLSTMYRIRKGH